MENSCIKEKPSHHREIRELKLLMRSATFCNDSKLIEPEKPGEKWKIIGDPTEASLLVAARKNGFDWEEEMKKKSTNCRASLRLQTEVHELHTPARW